MKFNLFPIFILLFAFSSASCTSKYVRHAYHLDKKEKKELSMNIKRLETESKNSEELISIIERVGEIGNNDSGLAIKKLYPRVKRRIRRKIRYSIAKIYNRGRAIFIFDNLVKNKDPEKRITGIRRLRKYFDESDKRVYDRIIPAMLDICSHDNDDAVIAVGIDFLTFFRIEESINILIDILAESNNKVLIKIASESLVAFSDSIIHRLIEIYSSTDKKWAKRKILLDHIMVDAKKDTIPYFKKIFHKANHSLRKKIIFLLRSMGTKPAYDAITSFLEEKTLNPFMKCTIIKTVSMTRDADLVPLFLDILKNEAGIYNVCIRKAFLKIGKPASEPLKDFFREESDREMKLFLIKLFGSLRAVSSVEVLRDHFNLEDMEMSKAAVWSLAQIGTIRAKDIFLKILEENISEMSGLAIEGLIALGEKVIPDLNILSERVDDERAAVNIIKILEVNRGPAFYDLIIDVFMKYQSDRIIRRSLKYFVKFQIKNAEDYIIPLLDHENLTNRHLAIEALGALKSEKSVSKIAMLMKSDNENILYGTNLQNTAAKALISIGPKAIPYLLKELKNENNTIRESSAWVLGNICDKKCIPSIKKMVSKINTPQVFIYRMRSFPSLTKVSAAHEGLRILNNQSEVRR